jgi:hypothetical protein
MLNRLPFTQLLRPTTLLSTPPITRPESPSPSFPTSRVSRLFLFAAGAWLATACTSESSHEQPATDASAPVAENATAEESSPNDGNDECRQIQDMWDALPKLETYKQFKRDETNCLAPTRVISYKFRVPGDDKALMTVALWDEDKDSNENAFIKNAKEVDQLTNDPNSGVRKSTLGIGEIPTVSGSLLSENQSGGKFICLFKGHYYFEILVALSDKSLVKSDAVESFVKEYMKQIDPGKLK